jgi:hypothetical protein
VLDDRTNPLGYYWEVIWDALEPDRFWAWVDADLADRIKKMADLQAFAPELDPAHWHPGKPDHAPPILPATRSWKQTRFDVANVQLSFHEKDRAEKNTPRGIRPCVVVEPDIDYYMDRWRTACSRCRRMRCIRMGRLLDARTVYLRGLRWMARRSERGWRRSIRLARLSEAGGGRAHRRDAVTVRNSEKGN